MFEQRIGAFEVFLALNVDVVAIAEVIAFATASYVDKTMHRLTLAEGLADISFGFFHRNLGGDNQLDIEVLWVYHFFVAHGCEIGLQR